MGNHPFSWLKDIIEKKSPIEEFSRCIGEINEIMEREHISFNDLLSKNNIYIDNENLANDFYRYCLILSATRNMPALPEGNKYVAEKAMNIFNSNIIGPICFITPEVGEPGKWTTLGGLGIMVYELSQGLASLGQEVIVISPYYNQNKNGNSNYLSDVTQYVNNISVNLDEKYEFGVHYGNHNDIRYYFLHNSNIFPRHYPDFGAEMATKQISSFAKATIFTIFYSFFFMFFAYMLFYFFLIHFLNFF